MKNFKYFALFGITSSMLFAAPNPPVTSAPLIILGVVIDSPDQVIQVYGERFDNGVDVSVTLGDYVIPQEDIVSETGEEIVFFAPEGLPDGDYLLTISTGAAVNQIDHYHLTIFNYAADVALQEAINEEAAAREAADSSLAEDLAAEAAAREAATDTADAALKAAIDAEAATREAADNAEAATRGAADAALQDAINTEAAARQAGDSGLGLDLAAEASTRATEDTSLRNLIDAETAARQADVDSLTDWSCPADYELEVPFGPAGAGPSRLCVSDTRSTPDRVNVVTLLSDTVVAPWCALLAKGGVPVANAAAPYVEEALNLALQESSEFTEDQIKALFTELDTFLNAVNTELGKVDDVVEGPINTAVGTMVGGINSQLGNIASGFSLIKGQLNAVDNRVEDPLNEIIGGLRSFIKSIDDPDWMLDIIDEGAVNDALPNLDISELTFNYSINTIAKPTIDVTNLLDIGTSDLAGKVYLRPPFVHIPQIDESGPLKAACAAGAAEMVKLVLLAAGATPGFLGELVGQNLGGKTFDEAMATLVGTEVADYYDAQESCAAIGGHVCTRPEMVLASRAAGPGLFSRGDWSGGFDPMVVSDPANNAKCAAWPPVTANVTAFPPLKMSIPVAPTGNFRCCNSNFN